MAAQAAAAAAGASSGAAAAAPYVAMGVSAGSGIVGAIANRRSQKRAYEYNRALMREQYQLEREQQDYQNAYNSPLEQRKRLEAAGFNPHEGIEGYQSADAAAPDPIPMQPLDYSSNFGQIANSINTFFSVQSQQQALKYQKLKNEEQTIHNTLLQRDAYYQFSRQTAEDWERRSRLYKSLMSNGFPKEKALKIAFAAQDNMESFVGDGDILLSQLADGSHGIDTPWSVVSEQEAARRAPWASQQSRVGYYRSLLDYNTANASAFGTMQRFDYLKEVNKEIDKLKLPYHVKAQMKFAAQSMIQDGTLLGMSPRDIVSLIGGNKIKTIKNITNTFNQKFNSEKTNIISPTN